MNFGLEGKKAVVTGGNAGIGRAIGRMLAAEGAHLCLVGRNAETLANAKADIMTDGGKEPSIIVQDLMSEDAADKIGQGIEESLGGTDILVNNAGGSRPFGKDATEAQWDEAITLNFTRQRQIAHRLLPSMQKNGWGRIVNITGKSEPDNVNGAFCAKAAMHSWSKGLSREVGGYGITVNCVPPGRIMSDQVRRNYAPDYREEHAQKEIPMGRYGEPEDLAALVVFLCSVQAQYITGTVIPVDGGLRRYQF
ncbi:MAG: SDR family oxidoreductase [Pseudomonadota bacterium]